MLGFVEKFELKSKLDNNRNADDADLADKSGFLHLNCIKSALIRPIRVIRVPIITQRERKTTNPSLKALDLPIAF
jgi:hypothetical protein